jgi:hypothetical protein
MNRIPGLVITAATVAMLSCGGDTTTATQVMVRVDAQAQLRASAHYVRLVVRSGQGEAGKWEDRYDKKLSPDTKAIMWPIELSLLPKDGDATRVYEVTATAFDAQDKQIAQVRAISGFVAHKALVLALRFDDECISKAGACDDDETCRAGHCIDAHVDADSLPEYTHGTVTGEPRDAGALPSFDRGGPDSAIDVVRDASTVGRDGGSDDANRDAGDAAGASSEVAGDADAATAGDAGQASDAAVATEENCTTNNGGCGDPQFFKCAESTGGTPTCRDIDECGADNGGCGDATYYKCTNNIGAAATCGDINECATNNGDCGDATYYKCTNNVGAAATCGDINECATNNGGCGSKVCTNKIGAAPTCSRPKCTGVASCSSSPSATCCVAAAITCGPNVTTCSGGSLCDCS